MPKTHTTAILALSASLILLLPHSAFPQVQQWKTPSGSTYIGNSPPTGSTIIASYSLSQKTRASEKPAYDAPTYEVSPLVYREGHITGSLRNLTDETFSEVEIEFNLYNSSGALIGTTHTTVRHLEAGTYWSFSAATHRDEASDVKLAHVTVN